MSLREEAGNILAVTAIKLRLLNNGPKSVFESPNHPQWLVDLRDKLDELQDELEFPLNGK